MTDKPDRRDGDGLLDALKAIASECQRWRDEQPTTDGASKGWALHLQGISESAIAASPTRDGAEGAGLADEIKAADAMSPEAAFSNGDSMLRWLNDDNAPPKPAPSWPQDAPPLRTELLGPDGMGSASKADLKRAYGVDQPAPDADPLDILNSLRQWQYDPTIDWRTRKLAGDAAGIIDELRTRKPAPDAMREALKAARPHIGDWLDSLSRAQLLEQVDSALSSAPVPPANSRQIFDDATATPWLSRMCQPVPPTDGVQLEDELTQLMESGPIGHRAMARKILSCFIFSPSPAVAAEPDATQQQRTSMMLARSASPTVRRDREALIHAICPHIRQWADSEEVADFVCKECPAKVKTSQGEGTQLCRINAEKAADAILSLPVQSVAPRLPQDTLDRLAMLNVSEDEVYEVLKKHLPEDMIDGIWQEIKEACRFAGVQSGAGEHGDLLSRGQIEETLREYFVAPSIIFEQCTAAIRALALLPPTESQ